MDADILRAVADRQAITDLLYRYCRAMDRIDARLGYTIWHDDGIADYGTVFQGLGREFVDFVCERHRGTFGHSHQLSNIIIELNGDRAASESYMTATLRFLRDDEVMQITVWNRYVDQWSRRADRCIDKRVTLIDFDEVRPVTAMRETSDGGRDRNDPSYAVLRAS